MRIFISYSRTDSQAVREVHSDLQQLGHAVWLDTAITGGQNWWDEVLRQIRNADVLVLAMSDESLRSRACRAEVQYALDLGKHLLPVIVNQNFSDSLVPVPIAETQRVNYASRDKTGLIEMLKALNSLPDSRTLPTLMPPEPPIPATYLNDLADLVTRPTLSAEEQLGGVRQLRERIADGAVATEVRPVIELFLKREDLLVKVHTELIAINEQLPGAPPPRAAPQPPSAAATQVSPPPVQPAQEVRAEPVARAPQPPPERAQPAPVFQKPPAAVPAAPRPPAARPTPVAPAPGQGSVTWEKVSAWWWLLPIFLNWIGGLVAYFALRDRNPGTAKAMLWVGIGIAVFWVFVGLAGSGGGA
jgi:hypothetical protein